MVTGLLLYIDSGGGGGGRGGRGVVAGVRPEGRRHISKIAASTAQHRHAFSLDGAYDDEDDELSEDQEVEEEEVMPQQDPDVELLREDVDAIRLDRQGDFPTSMRVESSAHLPRSLPKTREGDFRGSKSWIQA